MFRRLRWGHCRGFAPICCDTNDPDSIYCGFVKRLMRDLPSPQESRLHDCSRFIDNWLKTHMTPIKGANYDDMYKDWRAHLVFPLSRLKQYDEAHEALGNSPPSRKQCQSVGSFPKTEYYDEVKFMRMINSRSDAFKVFSGPYFKKIEDQLYQLKWFAKHLTPAQRMARINSMCVDNRAYFSNDFSAFESHFTSNVLQIFECKLYRYMFPDDPNIEVICNTLCGQNRMRLRNGFKVAVEGRRMSGDMCTSLGNGFTNLMLFLYFCHISGLSEDKVDALVEGDDGLFALPLGIELTADYYKSMGFTAKLSAHSNPCEAGFCRLLFGIDFQAIRDPCRFLSSFGWTHSFIDAGPKIMDQLLRAKALSCLYETPDCPIVSFIAYHALELTVGVVPRFVDDGYHVLPHDMIRVELPCPTLNTRLLFERKFGVSVSEQLRAEASIMRGDLRCLTQILISFKDSGVVNYDRAWYEARYVT